MPDQTPFKVKAAVAAVAVLSVFAAFNSFSVSSELLRRGSDQYGLAAAEERYAPVAQRLLPNTRVSYLTDLNKPDQRSMLVFLDTQYALAPRVLVPTGPQPKTEWAIGNFSQPVDFAAAGAASGWTMVEDLGRGLILYRRAK